MSFCDAASMEEEGPFIKGIVKLKPILRASVNRL
jgi:hypothetical protein